jgi:hypothetical protein
VPGSETLRRRGRLNALKRHRAGDDPAGAEAARAFAASCAEDYLPAAVTASRVAQILPRVVVDPVALERAGSVLRLVDRNVGGGGMSLRKVPSGYKPGGSAA